MNKIWEVDISQDPSLLADAVEYGLSKLGYVSIKPEQLSAVHCLLKGQNVFLSVSTGFGKSLMYQLLPFCAERLLKAQPSQKMPVVVVISPLVSLMYDQVSKLLCKNVRALCISGDQDAANDTYIEVVEGRVTHLFGSPEAFIGNEKWRSLFVDRSIDFSTRVVATAIDEAHCIVKW